MHDRPTYYAAELERLASTASHHHCVCDVARHAVQTNALRTWLEFVRPSMGFAPRRVEGVHEGA